MEESKIIEMLTSHTEQLKTLYQRMGNLEKLTESVNKMAIALERVTGQLTATEQRVEHIEGDVDEIRSKPAKRWDLIVTTVISALVGAGIALLLKQ